MQCARKRWKPGGADGKVGGDKLAEIAKAKVASMPTARIVCCACLGRCCACLKRSSSKKSQAKNSSRRNAADLALPPDQPPDHKKKHPDQPPDHKKKHPDLC
jgi:hypothetical protein